MHFGGPMRDYAADLKTIQPGTKVLFSAHCSNPNKKHPNDPVKCEFSASAGQSSIRHTSTRKCLSAY
jgi:hypothetical protein